MTIITHDKFLNMCCSVILVSYSFEKIFYIYNFFYINTFIDIKEVKGIRGKKVYGVKIKDINKSVAIALFSPLCSVSPDYIFFL